MVKKSKLLSNLAFDFHYVRDTAKIHLDEVDHRITGLKADPSNHKEAEIREANRSFLVEYAHAVLNFCEVFLRKARLTKTSAHYSKLDKYCDILRKIKENPKVDDAMLKAARSLFDEACYLWKDLQNSKQDIEDSQRKTFLVIYSPIAIGITGPLFWLLLPMNIDIIWKILALGGTLWLLYRALKSYLKLM